MMVDLTAIQALRAAGEHEQARTQLVELALQHPADPQVQYATACVHDALGFEREAVPYYLAAIHHGLQGEDLRGAYLGLGSTYRALGAYDDALITLRKGAELFPDAVEMRVFLAMSLYNLAQHQQATSILLHIIADTSADETVQSYGRAIRFYADHLDEIWNDLG